eukprot:206746-Chlamydomonas_euryale.AAC.1
MRRKDLPSLDGRMQASGERCPATAAQRSPHATGWAGGAAHASPRVAPRGAAEATGWAREAAETMGWPRGAARLWTVAASR